VLEFVNDIRFLHNGIINWLSGLSGWRSVNALAAAIQVRYPASAFEMVMWSPSQTGGFPPGTPVSSHTKNIRTQTSVPTSMINISCITGFVIVVK